MIEEHIKELDSLERELMTGMGRFHYNIIENCDHCAFYCDEGEFCRHPTREKLHVVTEYPIPEDCPLPLIRKEVNHEV